MRIHIASDFQFDINPAPALAENVEADVLVVAGDAHPPLTRSIKRLATLAARMPVIYVPGNRDFYRFLDPAHPGGKLGEDMRRELEVARDIANDLGITLLSDDFVEFGGVRFIGATLWTDLRQGAAVDAPRMRTVSLNDFHLIERFPEQVLSHTDYVELHTRSRAFIEKILERPTNARTVVVTHHAPHPKSIAAINEGLPMNGAFASDLSTILEGEIAPALWIHGAMHQNADYIVGRTRVISNSRGYTGENPAYRDDFVIELT